MQLQKVEGNIAGKIENKGGNISEHSSGGKKIPNTTPIPPNKQPKQKKPKTSRTYPCILL